MPKYKSSAKDKGVIIELIKEIPHYLPYLNLTKEQHIAINTYLTLSLHQGEAMKMAEFKSYSPEMAANFGEFYEAARPFMNSDSLFEMIFSTESDYAPNLANLLAYVKEARARRIKESSDVIYEHATYHVDEDENGDITHRLNTLELIIKIKEQTGDYKEAFISLENKVPEGFVKTEKLEDVANFFAYMNKYFSEYLRRELDPVGEAFHD
ncbi:hypothetical protein [Priestia megaterium]|uniref:hypothetical protein n=1 Tax=Priestia megaterium TaxID=1404 RepID=UPI000BEBA6F0|nr:hypothetical protein [Priestia megaterium]MED4068131.1 hypothetical protein [Priestia megaterium]PEA36834.1 hypothetical protein CON45_22430 [Priestia megaterium]PEE45326.1 hypothetical protein COM71_21370 [Priestia megaterium]